MMALLSNNAGEFLTDWLTEGNLAGARDGGNFIAGDGLTISAVDNSNNSRVDITTAVTLGVTSSTTVQARPGLEFISGALSLLGGCSDNQVLKWDVADDDWNCETDATGAGGSAITLDLGDDGGDDSVDLIEIATTGDTNNIFTEPSGDKLLIALANNWPSADTADALDANPTDCAANQFAQSIVASGNLTCAAIADADVPDTITIDLAATATALASNPSDCAADTKADSIDAEGDLTCTAVDTGDITDDTILEADLDAVNSATDEECLTFESGAGGDFEWQRCGVSV